MFCAKKKCPKAFFHELVCKPSSVLDDHLSRRTVACSAQAMYGVGRATHMTPILHQAGFTWPISSPNCRCALTAPFHPCKAKALRYISVALSLKSPPVGVTHRHCPVMLGLSSSCDAVIRLTRVNILAQTAAFCNDIQRLKNLRYVNNRQRRFYDLHNHYCR